MKQTFTILSLVLLTLFGTSAYLIKYNTGYAGQTGSPGEGTCNSCHGGGSSSASGITITSVPAFTLDQFYPDSTYQIVIQASAAGFTRYGFGCEILDPTTNFDAGLLHTPGSGVQFQTAFNGRRNAVHTTKKANTSGTVTFTFKWTAPSTGDATIYAIANAVNGNNTTSGDFVLNPVTRELTAGTPPPPPPPPVDTTGTLSVKEIQYNPVSQVLIFPNPVEDFCNLSYVLKNPGVISAELIDIKGQQVKALFSALQEPGYQSRVLDLSSVPSGIYFIKLSTNDQKISQKLITIH
jgi:hypothetical protein